MAIACPVDLDTQVLRSEVSKVYSRVANDPNGDFHFHRGPAYAAQFLGYDPVELAALPAECTASFAGIANRFVVAYARDPLKPGGTEPLQLLKVTVGLTRRNRAVLRQS